MSIKNAKRDTDCPFTTAPIQRAFEQEIAMFLHCHLRGYDRNGDGIHQDHEYYDKYGAPPAKENSWEEGYHIVEKKIAGFYNAVTEMKLDFPLIGGIGGGVHLYKPRHNSEPWNWTGWVPRQRRWLSQGTFFSNRHFLTLRGNEIQNNLWDYDPHDEEPDEDPDDMVYSQLEPNDRYQGGYWYQHQPFGRYLHVISLKTIDADPKTGKCNRYNYIVHPLAYRASIKTIPDNSVDAMQWCIINMPEEPHFGKDEPWGEKCHGLEIFNDFTYFYSYQPLEKGGSNNSELGFDETRRIDGDNYYYYWYDTYPMEFCIFLLDSALARGVHYHTMSANDAFYERSHGDDDDDEPNETLKSDPKGHVIKHNKKCKDKTTQDRRLGVQRTEQPAGTKAGVYKDNEKALEFFRERPYGTLTAFGSITLLDPRRRIVSAVFQEKDGIPFMGLEEGEALAMEYLREGSYYATTGLYKLFAYNIVSLLPFKIKKQEDPYNLCYEITEDMALEFTFLECSAKMADLIWRFTIMIETKEHKYETTHGYFKLDTDNKTLLDLSEKYELSQVKWLYFTAISPQNPHRRAWFHAIRGPAFGDPHYHARIPPLTHKVVGTTRKRHTVTVNKDPIAPTEVAVKDGPGLDFALGKHDQEEDVFVYFMQVCPHQQDFTEPVSDMIKESSDLIPPRILQSVHGYFYLRKDHPTRLNLNASWDKKTVKDNKVYFYRIDWKTGQPHAFDAGTEPRIFE